ncbi:MAG: hypothetical protein PHE55_15885, partial [Methylococcaceae bacterium]|nr:hypothetical protein [Methylococcaceae bacterium]
DLNDGTNNSKTNPLPGAKGWAIGMLTTERNTNLSKNYRYIKIDGYAPTIQQAAAGHYLYFSEAAYLWRKADPQPTGDQLVIIQKIAKDATSPTIFGQLNAAIGHKWGTGAYLAVSPQGYPVVHPFDPANPITPYTHAPGGLNLDNCRIPQVDDSANGRQPNL